MDFTSYERVKAALYHREPDRVPFDLGGAEVAGININALRKLKAHLRLGPDAVVGNTITQRGVVDDEIVERLKIDVVNVGPKPPTLPGPARDLGLVGDYYRLTDEWGMGWQMPRDGGHYYDLFHSPLADAETVQDVERFAWPDPLDLTRYTGMKEQAEDIIHNKKKAFVLGRMSSGMWEHAMWMTGYEKFLISMIQNKKFIHALMSKILEIKMQYWENAIKAVGQQEFLVISCADDLGHQSGLLVSLELYKEMIWPYHQALFQFVKRIAGCDVFVFFHTDGAIYDAIPLLIDAGVDILNPWQVNCAGMGDTARFKREYGDVLTIWGGSCDSQRVLPFGTPQEVRDETRRRIEDLAPGGGFVFAPIHVIQGDVPPENIMAWWETLQQYGAY